jgi:hypothetical protein
MSTTLQTFVDRTRRYLRDWPDQDALTASCTSAATSLAVADTTLYFVNEPIEIDQETMVVRALASGTSLTVHRGAFGSTAATHASSSTILVRPRFFQTEIIDAINQGFDACFPAIYKPVTQDYTGIDGFTYEYTIPSIDGNPIRFISDLQIMEPGDLAFRPFRGWNIVRGTSPFIKLRRLAPSLSTLRINGYAPFPHLSALTDTMDATWPSNADALPVLFAVSQLAMSGEALRVRADTGAIDNRESATKPGSSMAFAQQMLQRFDYLLRKLAMPPMPPHVVSVL